MTASPNRSAWWECFGASKRPQIYHPVRSIGTRFRFLPFFLLDAQTMGARSTRHLA